MSIKRGDFQSHGSGSCLVEHLVEVMGAALTPSERIACACHDVGKATQPWQKYIRGGLASSPHSHSLCGALLAAKIIRLSSQPHANEDAASAFHAITAHHGILYNVPAGTSTRDIFTVYSDAQAKRFFLEVMPILLPETAPAIFPEAWEGLDLFVNDDDDWADWKDELSAVNSTTRSCIFFAARSLLGRLCVYDQASAEKQSRHLDGLPLPAYVRNTPSFQQRSPRDYATRAGDRLAPLRKELLESVLGMIQEPSSCFYLVCAPTGTGKTEAMLQLAEQLLLKEGARKIIYAVPQVSLCEQLMQDYLAQADAQVWNHLRREYARHETQTEENNHDLEARLDTATTPFGSSYNVTTFNQVLFAAFHPHRFQCAKSRELGQSIIILDEFHKLPLPVQPYVFRLLEQLACDIRCRFILGSATPVILPRLNSRKPIELPSSTMQRLYQAPILLNRRKYCFRGNLTVDDVFQEISKKMEEQPRNNHLIVLNLVSAGTHPLREKLQIPFDPWVRLDQFNQETGTKLLVLDGLVPPALRGQYIESCRNAMNDKGGVVLISTQMIEVGVDLDFDTGLLDYQGVAATLQRAGRVGRESRLLPKPCPVDVFALETKPGQTSFSTLLDISLKHDIRRLDPAFIPVFDALRKMYAKEVQKFNEWTSAETSLQEDDLTSAWLALQLEANNDLPDLSIIDLFRTEGSASPHMGFHFENAQLLADLYGQESGIQRPVLLWPDQNTWEDGNQLIRDAEFDPHKRRAATRLIADWSVTTSPSIIELFRELYAELPPMLGRYCFVRSMDNIC